MTKDKYLDLCFRMDDEPDESKCPPDMDDFPVDVQKAILCYGKLGDKIVPDIGYMGKDLTVLSLLMDVYEIEYKDLFIETILILDQRMIEKSAEAMKQQHDQMKRKHGK